MFPPIFDNKIMQNVSCIIYTDLEKKRNCKDNILNLFNFLSGLYQLKILKSYIPLTAARKSTF